MEQNKQADMLSLLTEIRDDIAKQNSRSRFTALMQTVNLLGVLLLVATLIAALLIIVPPMRRLVGEVNYTVETLNTLDLDGALVQIETFAATGTEALAGVGQSVGSLQELDVRTLNAAIGKLGSAVDSFALLDFEALNTAVTNLNRVSEKLARFLGVG